MGNLVTDAMREYFDADFSFQNLGGLRADLPRGRHHRPRHLQRAALRQRAGRGARWTAAWCAGSSSASWPARSGGICTVGRRAWPSTRLGPTTTGSCTLEIGGEPWDPDRIYKVICTNFLMEGNSGLDFLTTIPPADVTPTQITTAEAVEHYVIQHSPVRPRIDDRWVEKPGQPQADYLKKAYMPES